MRIMRIVRRCEKHDIIILIEQMIKCMVYENKHTSLFGSRTQKTV